MVRHDIMGPDRLVQELKRLNPTLDICCDGDSIHAIILIEGCSDYSSLRFPMGYYFSEKNGITNKHNTRSGAYECYDVLPKSIFSEMMTSDR